MTTRYYKLPGSNTYQTWDYVHNNLGYTTTPTQSIQWKKIDEWGAANGYGCLTYSNTFSDESGFKVGVYGWYGLNWFAANNMYPGFAETITLSHPTLDESNVAVLEFDEDETRYLIQKDLEPGWMTEEEYTERGWVIVEDHVYQFILVDSTTGRITYGVENLTEIEFSPTGYFTIDEGSEVVFVDQSPFPVVCIDEGTRTAESIAPDDSFDTGLPYYASKLYIVTTDDGQDETLYGWEAEEGTGATAVRIHCVRV